jgi:hypothetical protein
VTPATDVLFARRMKGHRRCWVERIWTRRRAIESLLMPRAWNVRSGRGPIPPEPAASTGSSVLPPLTSAVRLAMRTRPARENAATPRALGDGPMVWVAAGRSGIGRQAAEQRAYPDRAVDVSRCARIKKPARRMPAGAVRRIAFRQLSDLRERVNSADEVIE